MDKVKIKTSWIKRMESLSDAECGRLFRGMLLYASTGETPTLSGGERIVWAVAMEEIDKQKSISDMRAEAGRSGCNKRWQTITNDNKLSQTITNDSKEKAPPLKPPVKENIKKTISKDIAKESPLNDALKAFKEMRIRMRKPMTELAVELLLKKLEKLSPGDVGKQVEIIYQSIENGWTGVYELKHGFRKERNTLKNYQEQGVSHPELTDIELDVGEL